MYKKLRRSRKRRILGGVCAGLADFFGLSRVGIRIVYFFFASVSVLPYIILWLLIPKESRY
ncbi:MAG: PspC domain-containing protein [Muribaculaceae bacterium]|nr:PspC domain-containing protein [Muribaculaceae bacterium]